MDFRSLILALLYGAAEGITEWLPISSTGHLILLESFLPLGLSEEGNELFLTVIQFGAALAVPFCFPTHFTHPRREIPVWQRVLIGMLPAGVIGVLFDEWIDRLFFRPRVVGIMLVLWGIIFILVEKRKRNDQPKIPSVDAIPGKTALGIGFFQMFSLIPGTSRSGSCVIGARLLGVSRAAGAEFSFLMALPVMLGASLLKGAKLVAHGVALSGSEVAILFLGALSAFIISLFVIRALVDFVRRYSFVGFGWYRISLGVLILLFL